MKKLLSIITILTLLMPNASYAKVDKDVNVAKVQAMLAELCYEPGIVDGAWGKKTETAVKSFFAKHYRKYDGNFDVKDANFILSAGASAKAFGSENIKKCLVVYSTRIEDDLKNEKIKQITQKVATKKKKPQKFRPFMSNGKSVAHAVTGDGTAYFPGYEQLPIELSPPANDDTLSLYFKRRIHDQKRFQKFEVQPIGNALSFNFDLRKSNFLQKQLSEKSILSYLFYENKSIIYDGLPPEGRFSTTIDDTTKFPSHSIGKSIVSYLVGNAICEGYIDNLDQDLTDWPLMNNTLYSQQPLIDILNMNARDHHVVTESQGMIKSGRWFNANYSLDALVKSDLIGTTPNKSKKFNYNGLATNIALNYTIYKTAGDWDKFLSKIFNEKVKIQNSVMFIKHNGYGKPDHTRGWYYFFASKYDYLRLARAMMTDWQSDNCVGKYLKKLQNRSIRNGMQRSAGTLRSPHMDIKSYKYGGFFYMDFPSMRNRNIFGMSGYGGQDIFIDMDQSRIIVINAATTNYDWIELGYNAIRYGKLR